MWEDYTFLKNELKEFEKYINEKFPTEKSFINNVSHDVIFSGGKRLRPALVIISAMMGDYKREKVFPVAAAIETLHTATLIHDDIIDNAKTRRGKPTVSAKHNVNMAVYTGDYLLANSVLLLSESDLPSEVLKYIAKAAKMICIGEVNQYANRYKLTSVASYLRRVMKKTGILFVASCVSGSHAAGLGKKYGKVMAKFGLNLGVAFQIRDDLLDIESTQKKEGKPVIHDICEGIATLPFIYAALKNKDIKKQLDEFHKGGVDIKDLILSIRKAGGADDARRLKNRYIQRCRNLLDKIPKNESLGAMEEILSWL